jgi:hypothetical protein
MKLLTLADWPGMVETAAYLRHALATVCYPILEVEARFEPFDYGRGFSLRVSRASKPRATDTARV